MRPYSRVRQELAHLITAAALDFFRQRQCATALAAWRRQLAASHGPLARPLSYHLRRLRPPRPPPRSPDRNPFRTRLCASSPRPHGGTPGGGVTACALDAAPRPAGTTVSWRAVGSPPADGAGRHVTDHADRHVFGVTDEVPSAQPSAAPATALVPADDAPKNSLLTNPFLAAMASGGGGGGGGGGGSHRPHVHRPGMIGGLRLLQTVGGRLQGHRFVARWRQGAATCRASREASAVAQQILVSRALQRWRQRACSRGGGSLLAASVWGRRLQLCQT